MSADITIWSPNWFEFRRLGHRVTIMRYNGKVTVTEDRSGSRPVLYMFEVPVAEDFEMLCAAEALIAAREAE